MNYHPHMTLDGEDIGQPATEDDVTLSRGLSWRIVSTGKPIHLGTAAEAAELGSVELASPGTDKDLNESYLGAPITENAERVHILLLLYCLTIVSIQLLSQVQQCLARGFIALAATRDRID